MRRKMAARRKLRSCFAAQQSVYTACIAVEYADGALGRQRAQGRREEPRIILFSHGARSGAVGAVTVAPPAASRRAVAPPRPEAPPVTSAIDPASGPADTSLAAKALVAGLPDIGFSSAMRKAYEQPDASQ